MEVRSKFPNISMVNYKNKLLSAENKVEKSEFLWFCFEDKFMKEIQVWLNIEESF